MHCYRSDTVNGRECEMYGDDGEYWVEMDGTQYGSTHYDKQAAVRRYKQAKREARRGSGAMYGTGTLDDALGL